MRLRKAMIVAPVALALVAFVWITCAMPLRADVYIRSATEQETTPDERIVFARQAVQFWTVEPAYRMTLASLEGRAGNFAQAEAQFAAADQLCRNDARIWAAEGLLRRLGQI